MRIGVFNAENLRARIDPDGTARLDGARDEPAGGGRDKDYEKRLDALDRALGARLIAQADVDVLALQEVFDQASLDLFERAYLRPLAAAYPHRLCLEGNDGGSRDVALLSRLPIEQAKSHAALSFADLNAPTPAGLDPSSRVFRRDCLMARCAGLWLFVCHFKADDPTGGLGGEKRRAEAHAVRSLIQRAFPDPAAALWLALGDFNETAWDAGPGHPLGALTEEFGVDLGQRTLDQADRWTAYNPAYGRRGRPDGMIASPALARLYPDARLEIHRKGLPRAAGDADERFPEVGRVRPRASDHALVCLELSPWPPQAA